MNEIKDYYGGMKGFNLEIHQVLNKANIETIKKTIYHAEFMEGFEKRLAIEYIEQLENNAETMRKIIEDYEEELRKMKSKHGFKN